MHGFIIASTFLAEVLASTGKVDEARQLATESIRIAKEKDDHLLCALSLGQRGNIEVIESNYAEAEKFYRESLSYEKKSRMGSMTGWFQIGLGVCMLMKKDYDEAKRILSIGIHSGKSTGDKAIILSGLIAFAWLALENNNVERAARLYGVAESMIQQTGYTMWNETRKMNDWVTAAINAAGDQENIVKARQEGNVMSAEAAIEFALS